MYEVEILTPCLRYSRIYGLRVVRGNERLKIKTAKEYILVTIPALHDVISTRAHTFRASRILRTTRFCFAKQSAIGISPFAVCIG